MKLAITLSTGEAVVDEPVQVTFRLTADAAGERLPFAYKSSNVTSLVIFGAGGDELDRADGTTVKQRLGFAVIPEPQGSMELMTLDPSEPLVWSQSILAYFDSLLPGSYLIQAELNFDPTGIALTSAPLPLTIGPNQCRSIDVVQDHVCLATTTFLGQHEDDEGARAILRIARTAAPGAFWEGTTIALPRGVEARLSEADFSTTHTFKHDFVRWVVWIDRGSLFVIRTEESNPAGPVVEVPLGIAGAALLGRPIQHADLSVSVLFEGLTAAGEPGVFLLDVDQEGKETGRVTLATLLPSISPLAGGADARGALYVVAAAGRDRLPLHLLHRGADGDVAIRELLSEVPSTGEAPGRAARIVGARVAVKAFSGPRAVLVAAIREHDPRSPNEDDVLEILQIFLDSPPPGKEAVARTEIVLWRGSLSPGETIVAADLARDRKTEVHALIATSAGRVFHVTPAGAIAHVVTLPVEAARRAALVINVDHDVFAFYPSAEIGVDGVILQRPPRP